jgi:ribosomal protein L37E
MRKGEKKTDVCAICGHARSRHTRPSRNWPESCLDCKGELHYHYFKKFDVEP